MPNARGCIMVLMTCLAAAGQAAAASDPAHPDAILIGYFGPSDPLHPYAGDMWRAASMAVEQANEAGGYEGTPFRLVAGWSESPWGSGVTDVVRMAYVHRVWAIVGGVDGPSAHLAEQVVAKARLALISPVATDKSVNQAGVPWMFSCAPPDDVQAEVLARALAAEDRFRPFVIVSATDHDSHLFTVELTKALDACKLAPAYHFQFDPQEQTHRDVMEQAARSDPKAVVLIARGDAGLRCLRHLRAKDRGITVFGGPWMGSRVFIEQVGPAAEGVIFPNLYVPPVAPRAFEQSFAERFGGRPDYLAAHTYDATSMLIAAIRRAGLDRARISEALREMAPWPGVSGEIRWDAVGANSRPVSLGTIRNGCVQPLDRPQ